MDQRLKDPLLRMYQADTALADDGREPETFVLVHAGGGSRDILHPRWDESWSVPSEHTIDDLEELGLLRVEPSRDKGRKFTLSMRGREEAAAVARELTTPMMTGGRAPPQDEVLRWLVETVREAPEAFDMSGRLLDRAVTEHLIEPSGREALARRILDLLQQGYLSGQVPGLQQTSAEDELALTQDLDVTIRAHRAAGAGDQPDHKLYIYGDVINSQVASGDISNYTTFSEVVKLAYTELDALEGIDPGTRDEAKGLLDRLLGKAGESVGETATGAAGSLVAALLARMLGITAS